MDRDTLVIRQHLVSQWTEVTAALDRMSPGAMVRPTDGWEVVVPTEACSPEVVRFDLAPVVFNVPERANHRDIDLFVVSSGWLELSRHEFRTERKLVTHAFATRAAYFRRTESRLEHVYGAHFDVTLDQLGHPMFHSQMRSFPDLAGNVSQRYNLADPVTDSMARVLRNVRVPTAQMDFFSFVLQVFADHLLIEDSGEDKKKAFNTLLSKSAALRGAAARSARLTTEASRRCLRAFHWYPVVA